MHSHDRTLLSRLGFADPDKTNPEHDRACRYLSLPENREAIFQAAQVPLKGTSRFLAQIPEEDIEARPWTTETKAICELAIGKGQGQYKTTIGFVDLVLMALRQWQGGRGRDGSFDFGANGPTPPGPELMVPVIGIEVKISPVSWADALRQINLYREYLPSLRWILAVRYDVTEEYVAALKNEGVIVIRLGKKFEEWITQDKKVTATIDEI